MNFKQLNEIYSDIEGINVLSNLVGDNIRIQDYMISEVENHNNNLINSPQKDKKNRTRLDSDKYYLGLIDKLSIELERRGLYQECLDVRMLGVTNLESDKVNETRMTYKSFVRSLREYRVSKAIELGMNKTNAAAISLVIEQLCEYYYD